jgi:glycosyltransferase involved in cell wall biosynthesis|tara:strand:- start:371 stop:1387 length:1017 start_codon:yes stop_codon:yes gene_type:complete
MKKLIVLCNEKVSVSEEQEFRCINADLQILPDGLADFYDTECIFRKSNIIQNHKFKTKKIKISSNIFKFLLDLIQTFKFIDCRYLIITITPYTFLSFLLLFTFKKKNIFVYLMSSGHEEWEHILGKWSVWIYDIMFKIITSNSKVIVCHERLFDKNKSYLVSPSRLEEVWHKNLETTPSTDIPRFLYVGRINPEKGIINFIKIFENLNIESELVIAGNNSDFKINNLKIKPLGYVLEEYNLIKAYDSCNMTILPSYTEAHPYVLEESLARRRPVIIFEDIAYVKKNKFGVFICKRNKESLLKITQYILKNYESIQYEMKENKLPLKKDMIDRFKKIIS